jgi:hypothetical protein
VIVDEVCRESMLQRSTRRRELKPDRIQPKAEQHKINKLKNKGKEKRNKD